MRYFKKFLYCHKDPEIMTYLIFCLTLTMLSACANVGPKSISLGRVAYNEAINKTENEQILLSIVKGRYGETSSLLALSGVASNIRFGTNAGIEAGFGPDENYTGNLVPFSGGLIYEENPTITYVPVNGSKYLRELLSPIPLDILILFIRNDIYSTRPLTLLVKRINDMQNPDFLNDTPAAPDLRFQHFVELFKELSHAGILQLVENSGRDAPFSVLISGYAPAYSDEVNELIGLLKLSMPTEETPNIIIPVYFGIKESELDGIAISTRSTYDLIQILKAAVEVPKEHVDSGLAITFPPIGLAGENIRIHTSKDEPKRAEVAVKHREYWFYIDEKDMETKLYYMMVRTLWSVSIAGTAEHKAAPSLTIPVSR
jgi:hypothetical protein